MQTSNPKASLQSQSLTKKLELLDDVNGIPASTKPQSASAHPTLLNGSQINPTITQQSYPAYVLPTAFDNNETHTCNLWGALCQTGSTVVGVQKQNSIMTTTIPCSSFLSAQASAIRHDRASLTSWRFHFGRSPECSRFAGFKEGQEYTMAPWLKKCPPQASTMKAVDVIPPGIYVEGGLNRTDSCCGPCAIFVPRVSLRYFPEQPDLPCGADEVDTARPKVTAAPNATRARTSLLISDGFTYTSGSIYFEIMGTASFKDDCGHLGTQVVSSTLAIPRGVMSTVSFDVPVGAELPRGSRASELRHLIPLKTRDLQCPTWGVNMPVATGKAQDVRIAEPFFPLLVPPPQLLAVDPAWSKCLVNHWPLRFGIFDPPSALTANSVMVDSSTILPVPQPEVTAATTNAPLLVAPSPAATPASDAPKETLAVSPLPVPATSNVDQVAQSSNLPTSVGSGQESAGSETEANGDAKPASSGQPETSDLSEPGSSVQNSDKGSGSGSNDGPGSGSNDGSNDGSEAVSDQNFNPGETAYPAPAAAHAMTVGSATYTERPDCSCYSLAPDKTLKPGSLATMTDGKVVSLATNGASAAIDGTMHQLSLIVTGVAPAFAGVLSMHLSAHKAASAINNASPNLGGETHSTAVEAIEKLTATATISANGCTMTAAPATGSGDLVVLGKAGTPLATLIPGGTAFMAPGGHVVSLGADGVLVINGKAVASLPASVTPTSSGEIAAAVATAFNLGMDEDSSSSVAEPSETPIKTVDDSMAQTVKGSQVKLSIPWTEICFMTWTYIIFVLY